MKVIKAVILLVLSLQVCTSTEQKNTCSLNPAFVESFKYDFKMLASPVKSNSSCQPEWSNHGSCCDIETLKTYVLQDKQFIISQVPKLMESLKDLDVSLTSAARQLSILANTTAYKASNSQTKAAVEAFLKLATTKYNPYMRAKHEACWSTMANIRAASMCSFCSSNSNQFFKSGKLNVAPLECSRIVSVCFDSLLEMARVSEIAKAALNVLLNLKGKKLTTWEITEAWTGIFQSAASRFCSEKGPLARCSNVRRFIRTTTLTSWMCSDFVILLDKPAIIKTMRDIFDLREGFHHSDKIFNNAPLGPNDWPSWSFFLLPVFDFRVDTNLRIDSNFESSFASTSQAYGQCEGDNMWYKPMNLSLAFP